MFDADAISETLDAKADRDTLRRRSKHLKPFRGIRGTPVSDVTRILAATWKAQPARLPEDEDGLHRLFCAAHEDGLVAIGLAAAAAPDAPFAALDIADRWLEMVDDTETADALGWILLGPALLASGEPPAATLSGMRSHQRPMARRSAVMAAMAALPIPLSGPSAAALRERVGVRTVSVVDAAQSAVVRTVLDTYLRDEAPPVRKGVIRVARAWSEVEPDAADEWLQSVRGGVPKTLRAEVEKAIKKARRQRGS